MLMPLVVAPIHGTVSALIPIISSNLDVAPVINVKKEQQLCALIVSKAILKPTKQNW